MCIKVWNHCLLSGSAIAPQTPISWSFSQEAARGETE